MKFTVTHHDQTTDARTGLLCLAHGTVETPAFAPVATRGAVRGILPEVLRECGTQVLLANAYHLELSPGAEAVARFGGLHEFMGWDRPIITDSGGYQVFSLAELNRITEDGVEFRSPLDGSLAFLGPEEATRIQNLLGSDVAMAFDECSPYPCSYEEAARAVERTLRWASICKQVHCREGQALFGIAQGSTFADLRSRCAQALVEMDFDGYAIGGVSVGEGQDLREWAVRHTARLLPHDRPRYLMGVGFPADVLAAVGEGIDLFDCVAPTRMGRNATAFTSAGRVRIRNSACRDDPRPLEEGCDCPACRLYSRAYLSHLFRCREMLGPVLACIHNLRFYRRMMDAARHAIRAGRFEAFRREFLRGYFGQKEGN